MTTKGIAKMQARDAVKFEAAKKIRELLDAAKREYEKLGGTDWEGEEAQLIDLVTGEDE